MQSTRLTALFVAGVATALCAVTATSASAAGLGYQVIDVPGGEAHWAADPHGVTVPGDSFRVCDKKSDSKAVQATLYSLDSFGHEVDAIGSISTAGHEAGYCSAWSTHDLPENKKWHLDTWLEKNNVLDPDTIRFHTVTS
ncbi:hypothetical protein [Streptomyces sp. NPDC017958]|uniref:hypothetical protein n=1 Tax=Streptomyces sp. NPDC017958 TaxID=3365021 RepID=UPI003798BB40